MATKLSSVSRIAPTRGATDGASTSFIHSASSRISIAHSSAMFLPPIFDSRAWRARRVPPHSGQGMKVTARSTNSPMCFCIASRSLPSMDREIFGTSPS